MRVIGEGLNELVDQLGTGPVDQKQLQRLGDKAGLPVLERLQLAYASAAIDNSKFSASVKDERVNLPPFAFHPSPRAMLPVLKPYVDAGYYNDPSARAHVSSSKRALLGNLLSPRRSRAAQLVRLVHRDARVRAAFEKSAGATVVNDGRSDGFITLQRASNSAPAKSNAPIGSSVSAMTSDGGVEKPDVYKWMRAMDEAILEEASKIGVGTASGPTGWGTWDIFGSVNGTRGMASGMSADGVTVGDEKTGSSVDLGVMQLKRMIDKRAQAMDSYNAVFTKYNENAKQAIDNLRG